MMTHKKLIAILALCVSSICFQSAWLSDARAANGSAPIPGSESLGGGWYSNPQFGDFAVLGSGWNWSEWFGYFYYPTDGSGNWIYSQDLEWCFVAPNALAASNWWFWVQKLSDWGWTTTANYPNLFLSTVGSWVWFDALLGDFYNYNTGRWLADDTGGGNSHTVDYVLVNKGFDATSWNMATQIYQNNAGLYGTHYEILTEGNELIIRYTLATVAEADALRSTLQQLAGDQGMLEIVVR